MLRKQETKAIMHYLVESGQNSSKDHFAPKKDSQGGFV